MGCMDCIKFELLFSFSVLFGILGIVLVSIGAITQSFFGFNDPLFVNFNAFSTPAIIISIGVLIFVIAFVGCCGVIARSYCMIKVFSGLLLVLLLLEIAAVVACYHGEVNTVIENKLNETMHDYYKDVNIQKSWDLMQREITCCGTESYSDWINIYNGSIPMSCCNEVPYNEQTREASACTAEHAFKIGCYKQIVTTLESKSSILGLSAIGASLVEVLMICVSCGLARSLRREYTTV